MKKKRVLKIGIILFIGVIYGILATFKNQPHEDSLFYSNIEALANGENPNPHCQTGPGVCTHQDVAYAGILVE